MAKERDDAATRAEGSDPVAAKGDRLAQAGGPGAAGEPAAAGPGYASGGPKGQGSAEASGARPSGATASNAAAPLVHTAMDGEVADAEEKAGKLSRS